MYHAKALAHQPPLPLPRLSPNEGRRSLRELKTTPDVLDNHHRDVDGPREVSEPLKAPQREHERQQVLIGTRSTARPCHLVPGRA